MPVLTEKIMPTHAIGSNEAGFRRVFTENALFLFACLLCGLPVWIPHFPPMVDLPQHAAQVAMFLNLGRPDFPFSDLFDIHLFTPYLFGYFLIAVATPLLGIVVACKLVISIALAAFAYSTRFLLRQAGADYYWSWLTFPALYGFTYQWGLLNFLVAAPLGILFLGVVWKQKAQPDLRSSLLITVGLYVLFFCHALIMGLFSLIALSYWLITAPRFRDFIRCAWPMFALAPLVLTWLIITSRQPGAHLPIQWDLSWNNTTNNYYTYLSSLSNEAGPGWGRITGFIPRLLGAKPGSAITLLGITLIALPFLAGSRINTSRVRWIPMLVIALVLLFMPSFMLGTAFTFERFTVLAMPLFLLMIDVPADAVRVQRRLRLLAPLIAFGWIGYATNHALHFDKAAEDFDTILASMEPGKRTLSLIFTREDNDSIAPTFLQFPAWYSALKSGVTDPSFAVNFQPVAYKPEYIPRVNIDDFAWHPQVFNWSIYQGGKYDYFVVSAPVDAGRILFKDATCIVERVAHAGQWWLYRRGPGC